MAKVLVLYYSTCGHIETMANAVAEGARAAVADVDIKRVPETAPAEPGLAAWRRRWPVFLIRPAAKGSVSPARLSLTAPVFRANL